MAARVRSMPTLEEPWPHSFLDGFLPGDLFAGLVAALPGLKYNRPAGTNRKADELPAALTELLLDPVLVGAFGARFGCTPSPAKVKLEVAWTGQAGLLPHVDRKDKLVSAQVYLAGDPKGTELYDAAGELAGVIEWAPNRLAAWTRPAANQKHSAPKSSGRFVLLYWFME